MPGEDFYLQAFWSLSTERQMGMAMGPIPQSAIIAYGLRAELDSDTMGLFEAVIRSLDAAYIDWALQEQKKARERAAKNKGTT